MKPTERALCREMEGKKWEELQEHLSKMLVDFLSAQKGNMATIWAGKLFKLNGLPRHPVLLSLASHFLESVDRVVASNGVWVKTNFKANYDPHRKCVVFKREGVELLTEV